MKKKMQSLEDIIHLLRLHRTEIKGKYKIKSLKVFGSYAEGTQGISSDIDIIVEFYETPTFIELVRIEQELSHMLGVKVDLLTEESISPFIRPYIKDIEVML